MERQQLFKHVRKIIWGVSICLSSRHHSKVNCFSSVSLKPYLRNYEMKLFKIERDFHFNNCVSLFPDYGFSVAFNDVFSFKQNI